MVVSNLLQRCAMMAEAAQCRRARVWFNVACGHSRSPNSSFGECCLERLCGVFLAPAPASVYSPRLPPISQCHRVLLAWKLNGRRWGVAGGPAFLHALYIRLAPQGQTFAGAGTGTLADLFKIRVRRARLAGRARAEPVFPSSVLCIFQGLQVIQTASCRERKHVYCKWPRVSGCRICTCPADPAGVRHALSWACYAIRCFVGVGL